MKVISANDLADGKVVYLVAAGKWTRTIAEAKVFAEEEELKDGLGLAKADEKHNLVVDAFAVEVTAEGSDLEAVSLRNAIRAKGPTVDYLPPRI